MPKPCNFHTGQPGRDCVNCGATWEQHFPKRLTAENAQHTEDRKSSNFDFEARARKSDPDTSREAADALTGSDHLSDLQRKALRALFDLGGRGTIEQCVDLTGVEWKSLSPRFAPLLERKYIHDTGDRIVGRSGRRHIVFALTDSGFVAL